MPIETFSTPQVTAEQRPDGATIVRSAAALGSHEASLIHVFRDRSRRHPDRLLLADRRPGGWRYLTWGQARVEVDRIAGGLQAHVNSGRPIMILAGNTQEHLLVMLAAWTLGVPVAPTSVAYSLQSRDYARLAAMVELVDPEIIFVQDRSFAPALRAVGAGRTWLSASEDVEAGIPLAELTGGGTAGEVDLRCAAVGTDTLAKVLFTSGSTGSPKGVVNPHGMLAANQAQIRLVWPFLDHEPPVLLDWLPWSHTFGGNHNLGLVLAYGGSLWVDDGRPAPELIERTARNLTDVSPTIYLNVPAGYAALLPLLEARPEVAEQFLRRLRLAFFAAAALPQQLWDRMEALADKHGASMRMTTSWGMTETAPAATTTHFATPRSDCIGVPLPGVELKLVPSAYKTELRLRGPNVTPGYLNRPDLTGQAFDEEGFLCTGDAVELIDPYNAAQGLVFKGRVAEDFKLATGTFVSVGTLRPALLSAAGGLLSDAVLTGEGGDYVGALVWLHPDHAARCDPAGIPSPDLRGELEAALARLAGAGGGSSQRVDRLLILVDAPALDAGEITDKGYVNQRVTRTRRADDVSALHQDPIPVNVVLRPASK